MSEFLTVTVDRAEFDAVVANLEALGGDTSKPMKVVARIMEQNVRNTFRDETDPWGHPWPPLDPLTLAARRRAGNTRVSKLVDTAAMFDSIRSESGADFAQVSIDGPAEVHQYGTTTIPARAMFPDDDSRGVPDVWWDSVAPPIVDALAKAIDG